MTCNGNDWNRFDKESNRNSADQSMDSCRRSTPLVANNENSKATLESLPNTSPGYGLSIGTNFG